MQDFLNVMTYNALALFKTGLKSQLGSDTKLSFATPATNCKERAVFVDTPREKPLSDRIYWTGDWRHLINA